MIDAVPDVWKLVLRLVLAVFCGYVIGRERKARSKEAGVRTHAIVCLASALMMMLSKYAFMDMESGYDVERIAAQIVTGVGFLGAGMIFYRRDIIQGLTTAAGVWATAGIGMAIGAGMIVIGLVSALLILFIQIVLHINVSKKASNPNISISMKAVLRVDNVANINEFKELFGINSFMKYRTYTIPGETQPRLELEFTTREDFSVERIYDITSANPYILSLETTEE